MVKEIFFQFMCCILSNSISKWHDIVGGVVLKLLLLFFKLHPLEEFPREGTEVKTQKKYEPEHKIIQSYN